jgi:hypothetical protein
MDVRILAPDLRSLDDTAAEVCACTIFADERPARGLAGLLDWRLAGRLSALLVTGFFRGDVGETLLVPGKPHLPYEKLLFAGLGPRKTFDEEAFVLAVDRLAALLAGLRVRRAVVELPGRASGVVAPEQAVPLALERLGPEPEFDVWWLVEDARAQRVVDERIRRRVRAPGPAEG